MTVDPNRLGTGATASFDDPVDLAAVAAALPLPVLVGLDVDGVLAPIVDRAPEATLLPGVLVAIGRLAGLDDVAVAVVSGRALNDLGRFGFPDQVDVFGTHGLERRDAPPVTLGDSERHRYDRLAELAERAARAAGDGAWVEIKPAGVVLHVREAPPETSAASVAELHRRAEDITGAHVKAGKSVVELLARTTSKATAVTGLRGELGAASVVFVGDDRTDEEVFAALGAGDCSIRVGDGDTAARHRLADPTAVLQFLHALIASLAPSA